GEGSATDVPPSVRCRTALLSMPPASGERPEVTRDSHRSRAVVAGRKAPKRGGGMYTGNDEPDSVDGGVDNPGWQVCASGFAARRGNAPRRAGDRGTSEAPQTRQGDARG